MLMETVPKQETDWMSDDLKFAPKDEDEMEDFRDYGDEGDDVDSKLDDYEDDEDEDEDDEAVIAAVASLPPEVVVVAVVEEVIGEAPKAEAPPARKPVKSASKAAPKPVVKKAA